jgi:filamentous hemagglutinin
MMMGFASGFLASGGDLKAGLIGAATAGLMNGIGSQYQGLMDSKCFSDAAMIGMKVEKAFLEGVVGGAASALNKGDFRDGFLGAASGSLAGSFAKLSSNRAVATAQAAAIGGTVSTIGGGKFGNGAITATYAYVFNSLAHPQNTYEAGVRQAILKGDVSELEALLGNGTLSAQDALIAQRSLAAMRSAGTENSALLAGRYGVDWVNKVGHIFEGAHQGPVGQALLRRFGSPIEAMAQVQRALEVTKPSTGLFSNTFQTTVNVQGVAVPVRGALVDGVYRIGTILKW